MIPRTLLLAALAAAIPAPGARLWADVRMPAIFGDHMVLQQQHPIPVWGWAAPGERVSVRFGSQAVGAVANAAGKWRVNLAALPASSAPGVLTVAGRNQLQFQDVLVGDVWLASGQSNMEFGVKMTPGGSEEIAKANHPSIRLFCVPHATAATPRETLGEPPAELPMLGHWQLCTPETLAANGPWEGFSGVAYYFGRDLQQCTKQPLGLVASYRGGTPAQAWTSLPGLEKAPPFSQYIEMAQRNIATAKEIEGDYPRQLAAYLPLKRAWDAEVKPGYEAAMKAWNEEAKRARDAGQAEPPRPQPARPEPPEPRNPFPHYQQPTCLFNAMIAPLIPFAIRGVVWYQGESNANAAAEYATLFPRMIADWRTQWGQGDFPFLFVQLAGYAGASPAEDYPLLRESQGKALAVPGTGMASAIDIGGGRDIHPRDKKDVGARLARLAAQVAYGGKVVGSGPLYQDKRVEPRQIRIAFSNYGSGLTPGLSPLAPKDAPVPKELTGFTIAGADQHFVEAKARIDSKNVITVSSEQVPVPVAVRYGWAGDPVCNLYNREGLPASPFRTDAFPQ